MRSPLRRLLHAIKRRAWRLLDQLGARPQRITSGPARGLTMVAPVWRGQSYCKGHHEPHVMTVLSEIVHPGMVVCDAGSHLGYYTLALAQLVGVAGHVYAFEPLPRHVALLRRTMARNRLTQVTIVPRAVGDRTGCGLLEEWPNDAMTRIADGSLTPWGLDRLEVPVTTLDDWAQGIGPLPRLDLIKLDIEGQELAALQGAVTVLSDYRPHVICEIHRRGDIPYEPHEIIDWLQVQDYAVFLIPALHRPDETLNAALARLESAEPRPGWVAVAHVLARPRAL